MNIRRITNPNPIIKETKENLIRELFMLLLAPPPPLIYQEGVYVFIRSKSVFIGNSNLAIESKLPMSQKSRKIQIEQKELIQNYSFLSQNALVINYNFRNGIILKISVYITYICFLVLIVGLLVFYHKNFKKVTLTKLKFILIGIQDCLKFIFTL